ncbi:MAG: DUF885 domain-containing protein, partial [Gammaproteobacteria bacterium]|nr:DUF885 domain-containing protein [Gammaproteobacteria bacterium]
IKKDQDKWNDISDENAKRELEITRRELKELRETIDYNKLDEPTKLSYRLYVERAEQDIENFQYRLHNYPINQMYGAQSRLPSFLINIHRIDNETDARGYIARLNGIDEQITQVIENLKLRESKGIVAPKFVFPYAISDTKNVLSGKPFVSDALEDSALLADFKKKVANIEIDTQLREELITEASGALAESVKPAFGSLIEFLMEQEKRANTDDGAWKLPDGEAFYAMALKRTTTTDMTADEIHELGLSEVARIHEEMRAIMEQVEFDGTLQEFFEFMRTDKQFYYDETPEGRAAYLAKAEDIIDTMRGRLDELFVTKPKADLVVKAVEAFREKSAGKAFYQRPAPDGSRPGTYYANLYKMSDMPMYQMEALAYHEGIPGHHMQLAIAQELKDVPSFRKYGRYTAYTEGWGLYSELVPKEMGFYSDPYSDFGRLAMEIWRACRLVVDTGIHHKKWTREQAIDYLSTNTPNPYGDVVKAIERYIVMPSQATAYKIGMIKIVELRDKARAALGDDFDVREFHEVVLRSGPVPLSVLEDQVADYVARKSQERA